MPDARLSLQDFFFDLTAERSLWMFAGAFVVGSVSMFAFWATPWLATLIPSVVVAAYGGSLWYSQGVARVVLSSATRNSPYFLGFLLTLMSFFTVFYNARGSLVRGDAPVDQVLGQVGAGIFSTVIGLFLRHVLIVTDPRGKVEDTLAVETLKQVRTHWREFAEAQTGFVALIREFVDSREELFNREEKAHQQYVARLEQVRDLVNQINRNYPTRMQGIMDELDSIQQNLTAGSSKLGTTLSATSQHLSDFDGSLQDAGRQLRVSADSAATSLHAAAEEFARVESQRTEADRQMAGTLKTLAADLNAIDSIVDDVIHLLERRLSVDRQ